MHRKKPLSLFHRVCVGIALFLGTFAAGLYFLIILPPLLDALFAVPR